MSETFTIKRDDTLPVLQAQLWADEAKTTKVDLTTATGVNFHMMQKDELENATPTLKVEATGTVVGAATDGVVQYAWSDVNDDTDTADTFYAEFEVEWASGDRTTYPNDGYIIVVIVADLDTTNE